MRTTNRTEIVGMALVVLFFLTSIALAEGEWAINGNNMYNINTGKVGIGTTSPGDKLHVLKASGEGDITPASPSAALFQRNTDASTSAGITILGGSVASSHVYFADKDDANIGKVSYSHSSDKMTFVTNDATQVAIDSSGNVGIGTTSPNNDLTVLPSSAEKGITVRESDDGNDAINVLGAASDGLLYIRNAGSAGNGIQLRGNGVSYINGGNLGVGTAEPSSKLDVIGDAEILGDIFIGSTRKVSSGTSAGNFNLVGGGTNEGGKIKLTGGSSDGDIKFFTGGAIGNAIQRAVIDSSGNIGIGTPAPGAPLHVLHSAADDNDLGIMVEATSNERARVTFRRSSGNASINYTVLNQLNIGTSGRLEDMTIDANGRIGIGTASPGQLLQLMKSNDGGDVALRIRNSAGTGSTDETVSLLLDPGSDANLASSAIVGGRDGTMAWARNHKGNLQFHTSNGAVIAEKMRVTSDGNVGIGTTSPQSKLAVTGTITAKEIKVTETGWSDFVFEDAYELPSLNSVESYIKNHKHLPDIPSAKDVEEQGLAVSEMLAKQMQKIEEMTLYLIELKKENNLLKATIANQDIQLASLKELRARIEALEQRN